MFNKGTDHGNDVMMGQFVFLSRTRHGHQKLSKFWTIMSMVCTFSDHRNDQEMVKMFKTLQRNISPVTHGYT